MTVPSYPRELFFYFTDIIRAQILIKTKQRCKGKISFVVAMVTELYQNGWIEMEHF